MILVLVPYLGKNFEILGKRFVVAGTKKEMMG